MNKKILAITFATLSLSGCGKFLDKFGRLERAGFTSITIDRATSNLRQPGVIGFHSPLEMITSLSGGLIVYARNTGDGQIYSESIDSVGGDAGEVKLLLPNGNYEFTAVGWPTANLTGSPASGVRVRCAAGPAKTLTGGSDTVYIDLRNLDECYDDPDFVETYAKSTSPFKSMFALNLIFCNQFATITGKNDTSSCANHESSGAFYNGDLTYTKIERISFLSGTNSLFFTASHNSQLSSGVPTKPYELFKYDFDTGVQTKIGMQISAGFGITTLKAVPNRNKLLFIRDQDTSGTSVARELWVYDDDLETLTQIGGAPANPSTADGIREFRVTESGDRVVYVGDMNTTGIFELFSAPLTGTSYTPIASVSGTLTGAGVASCSGCGNHGDSFYFQISPGTTNNYVLYSAEKTSTDGISTGVANRSDLRISTLDGTDFTSVNIHGATPADGKGFRVSQTGGSNIDVASDQATQIGFSHDGTRLLYHAKTGGGTVDKVFHISVALSGTALTVADYTEVVSANATYPYFKMGHTGTGTKKALVFSKDSTNSYQPLVSSLNLMSPGTVYPQLRFALNTGNFGQVYLKEDDSYVVVAAKDNTELKVKEIRSAPVTLSNWGGGSAGAGASVSHNSSLAPIGTTGEWINPIEGGDGDSSRVFTVNDNEDTLLFLSSEGTNGTVIHYRLYGSTIGASGNTLLSHTDIDTAAESVTGAAFAPNGDKYFTADADSSGTPELYKVDLSATDKRVSMGSDTYMSTALSVVPQHEDEFEGFPDLLPVIAGPKYVPGVKELWFFDTTSLAYTRSSTLAGSHASESNKGAGRAMVRIMKDRHDLGEAVAFQSDCLSLSANTQDGNWITSNVRIPTGIAGDSSPFHTVIDFFAGATDCNGGYRRHSFPNGLADYSATFGADAKLAGDGIVDLVLFLRDP